LEFYQLNTEFGGLNIVSIWRNNFMKKLFMLVLFFLATSLRAQEAPIPANAEAPVDDPELKNLEWNRFVTKNFTVMSIDLEKGKWLSENIDDIKTSLLTRWGFPDVKFEKECRVFCVPNHGLLKKLFNLSASKSQLRKDINVLWVVLDDKPEKNIYPQLVSVAISEYETAQKTTIPYWFKRGACFLSMSVSEVRQSLKDFNEIAKKEQFTHSADQIFTSTEEEYNKQNSDNKKIYDQQAACLCLMLRKEFGEAKLQGFLRLQSKNKPEIVLGLVYGFKSFSDFDKKYIEYMKDLCDDISDNKTPDFYFEIVPVGG
jgi:hypothetical protein